MGGICPAGSDEDLKVDSQLYLLQTESLFPRQIMLLSAGWQSISGTNATTFAFTLNHSQKTYSVVFFWGGGSGEGQNSKNPNQRLSVCNLTFISDMFLMKKKTNLPHTAFISLTACITARLFYVVPEAKHERCLTDTCHNGSLVFLSGWF